MVKAVMVSIVAVIVATGAACSNKPNFLGSAKETRGQGSDSYEWAYVFDTSSASGQSEWSAEFSGTPNGNFTLIVGIPTNVPNSGALFDGDITLIDKSRNQTVRSMRGFGPCSTKVDDASEVLPSPSSSFVYYIVWCYKDGDVSSLKKASTHQVKVTAPAGSVLGPFEFAILVDNRSPVP
jgi:hypothetical protein